MIFPVDKVETAMNMDTGVQFFMEQRVLTSIICLAAAVCICGALVIWFAIEREMRNKP
jgi:hypothetical protein